MHSFVVLLQQLCLSHAPSFPFCAKKNELNQATLHCPGSSPNYKHNRLFVRSTLQRIRHSRSRGGAFIIYLRFFCDNDTLYTLFPAGRLQREQEEG